MDKRIFQVIVQPVATSHDSIISVIEGALVSAIGFIIGFAIGNALMSAIWIASDLAIWFAIGLATWGAMMGAGLGLTIEEKPYLVLYLSCVSAIWSAIMGVIFSVILNTSRAIWEIIGGIGMCIIWIIIMGFISGSASRDRDKKKVPYLSCAVAIGFPIGFVIGFIIKWDAWVTIGGAIAVAVLGIIFAHTIEWWNNKWVSLNVLSNHEEAIKKESMNEWRCEICKRNVKILREDLYKTDIGILCARCCMQTGRLHFAKNEFRYPRPLTEEEMAQCRFSLKGFLMGIFLNKWGLLHGIGMLAFVVYVFISQVIRGTSQQAIAGIFYLLLIICLYLISLNYYRNWISRK